VGRYEVDDDPDRIDLGAVCEFLTTEAYWGRGRTVEVIKAQVREAWRVVGAYTEDGEQVGFARACGDGYAFAYLADVYVLGTHRGHGLGKQIVQHMIDDGPGASFRWSLHTSDAHGLYRRFGFTEPGKTYLERPARSI
jgi:GNAT superfamily N-acetyltransferase